MDRQRLLALIDEQDSLRREVMTLSRQDPEDQQKYRLYQPATDADIARFEHTAAANYPASYRQFLSLHNGWLGFWPDWSLIGVPREENKAMFDDVKLNFDLLPDVVGTDELEALSGTEKHDSKVIRLDRHVVIGTDFNGSFLVLDDNRVDADGEPQVAWVHYLQHVENRWTNFEHLLMSAIEHTRTKRDSLRTGH